jgi:hypothetical protein
LLKNQAKEKNQAFFFQVVVYPTRLVVLTFVKTFAAVHNVALI